MTDENAEPTIKLEPHIPIGVPTPEIPTSKRTRGMPAKSEHVAKSCLQCGSSFLAPFSRRDVYHFCSDACRWRFHEAKMAERATPAAIAEAAEAGLLPTAPASAATPSLIETAHQSLALDRALSPAITARLRGRIASKVAQHIDLASAVVEGTIAWTPTQARVFSDLLKKVVPDLSASQITHEANQEVSQFSRAELERLAAGDDNAIEILPEPTPSLPPGSVL